MRCNLILIILGLGIEYSQSFWPPSYQMDLRDKQTFEISSDEDYDENENEMIQPKDVAGIESLVEDAVKYEPLHYHVENYNRRIAEEAEKSSKSFTSHPLKEPDLIQEPKPFIDGFEHGQEQFTFEKLDNMDSLKKRSRSENTTVRNFVEKLFSTTPTSENLGYVDNNHIRIKRSDEEDSLESTDFLEGPSNGKSTTEETIEETTEEEYSNSISSQFTESITETDEKTEITVSEISEYEEEESTSSEHKKETVTSKGPTLETEVPPDYDYEKLKAEYDQQLQKMQERNETFNYIDRGEPEEIGKDILKKIVDFKLPKNCTKEELSHIGVKAFECLMHDYKLAKNKTQVKQVFSRAWSIIKIWIIIYIIIAIPCWCQNGWCCCCFCCEICFPMEVIQAEKKYFAENPPGTLVKRTKVNGIVKIETEEYKPTLFENDAYEKMESQIRNL